MTELDSSKRALAIIAARGGSKGVPGKNKRDLGGRPLIARSIDAAVASRWIDRVVVSTDDSEIAGIAKDHGAEAPFLRPPQIAGDDSNVIEAIVHALEWLATNDAYYPAVTVLLQPTSPFRTSHDIDAAIDLLVGKGADSVISVCVPDHSPYWMYNLDEEGRLVDFVRPVSESRRQDMPRVYFVNGAVYAARTETLLADRSFFKSERKYPYLMDTDRSLQIDTEMEFLFAEALVAKQSG